MSTALASTSDATNSNKRKPDDSSEQGASSKKKTTKKLTPYDEYFAKKNKFMSENNYIGSMLIKGLQYNGDDDDDEENQDTSKYTEEQMNSLLYVLVTQKRADQLEEMRKLILGDQADQSFMMFNTSFSYTVEDSLGVLRSILKKKKSPADKFDTLFAYTDNVSEFDVWMHDNEGGMDVFTKGLASIWKRLLKNNSDEDLGIDGEYTKPALMEFLKQFKKKCESQDTYDYPKMRFNYK